MNARRATTSASRPTGGARGQALVETILFALVLVPLLLLALWLGRLADLRLEAQSAARTLAFECTVRGRECIGAGGQDELADETRRRGFVVTGSPLRSDGRGLRPATGEAPTAGGVDRGGRPLLARFEDIRPSVAPERFDAGLAQALGQGGRVVADAARLLSQVAGPDRFGLSLTGGLAVARIEARTAAQSSNRDLATSLDAVPVTLHARAAVLSDPWAASMPAGGDPESVARRVGAGWTVPAIGAFPTDAALSAWSLPVRGLLDGAAALRLEPAARGFRYHAIDVDLVPPDRLGPADAAGDAASRSARVSDRVPTGSRGAR